MTDEMKPVNCGCGGEAKVEPLPFETWNDKWDASASQYFVCCDRCGMTTRLHDTEAEAVAAWNRAMGADQFRDLTKKIERKKGKWIPVDSETVNGRCSVCGYESHLYENDVYGEHYCPNCGAWLRLT